MQRLQDDPGNFSIAPRPASGQVGAELAPAEARGMADDRLIRATQSLLRSLGTEPADLLDILASAAGRIANADSAVGVLFEPGASGAAAGLRLGGRSLVAGADAAAYVCALHAAAAAGMRLWTGESEIRALLGATRVSGEWGRLSSVCWVPLSTPVGDPWTRPHKLEPDQPSITLGGIVCETLVPAPAVSTELLRQLGLFANLVAEAFLLRDLYVREGTGPLAGLVGREGLMRLLRRLLPMAIERGSSVSLTLLAVDHLKDINAKKGYEVGDEVVRKLTALVLAQLLPADVLGHIWGATLAVVSADARIDRVLRSAEEVREAAQRVFSDHPEGITVSVGVADSTTAEMRDADTLLRAAAAALELARQRGGNRTERYDARTHAVLDADSGSSGRLGLLAGNDLRALISIWGLVSGATSMSELRVVLGSTLEQLLPLLRADRAELFLCDAAYSGPLGFLVGRDTVEGELIDQAVVPEIALECRARRELVSSGAGGAAGVRRLAVPLITPKGFVGVLHVAAVRSDRLSLDANGIELLRNLGELLGKAVDHMWVVEDAKRHRQAQERLLREENRALRSLIRSSSGLVTNDAAMLEVVRQIQRVAASEVTVLVTGESGTGKERVCRLLHEYSARSAGPYVVVDCGAIPETLLESELFGHERGAFTGALTRRKGRFEFAAGGTLVLDEIGELPLALQVKLLRVIQEKTIRTVGGDLEIAVDFRLVLATNRNLELMVKAGQFRQDLYYRITVVPLHLPALRERGEDVLLLANYFLRTLCAEANRPLLHLPAETARLLLAHPWPGNVRELENRIRRAAVMAPGPEVTPSDLGFAPAIVASEPRQPAPEAPRLLMSESVAAPARAPQAPPRPPVPVEPQWRPAEGVSAGPARSDLEGILARWLWERWKETPDAAPPMLYVEAFLLREALNLDGDVISKAASRLDLSRATLRKRLQELADPRLTELLQGHGAAHAILALLRARRPGIDPPPSVLERCEAAIIRELLVQHRGNQKQVAAVMGFSEATMTRRLKSAVGTDSQLRDGGA
ncbi:MAG: sigma 54-interacting transcriptional regulator [Candidatus Schekmanbacteria bacterium]|nr:sigma 54-interacting transcriptional regulator [Candidatus Schekmanbacteria bacterium]